VAIELEEGYYIIDVATDIVVQWRLSTEGMNNIYKYGRRMWCRRGYMNMVDGRFCFIFD